MTKSKLLENWGLIQLEIEMVRNNSIQYLGHSSEIEVECFIETKIKPTHIKKEFLKSLINQSYLIRVKDVRSGSLIFEKHNK